ncbi:MAG: ATP-grasp domain-containing protein [bacterium]
MNVMIIFGGESYEHDVSIITGCVAYNLLKDDYKLFPIYINKHNELYYYNECNVDSFKKGKKGKKVELVHRGFKQGFSTHKIDVAIIATHGINGEDGMSKAILDFYKIPSIGSSLIASAVNMDKYYSYCILNENKINVVDTTFITKDNLVHNLEYPVILKPSRLGSSIGIQVAYNEEEYNCKVKESLKFDNKIVVQKYLDDIEELNISLYKNKFGIEVSNIEIVDKHEELYTYEDKYTKHISKRKYLDDTELISKIREMAIKSYEIFDLSGIVRIDFIYHDNEIYLNEINTIPGSLSNYLYDEEFTEIIKQLISKVLFDTINKECIVFNSNVLFYDYNMKK